MPKATTKTTNRSAAARADLIAKPADDGMEFDDVFSPAEPAEGAVEDEHADHEHAEAQAPAEPAEDSASGDEPPAADGDGR